MSKLERLLNLTALLLDGSRPMTVDEIGRNIPGYPDDPASFRRSFERDKDDLRELGIPIQLVPLSAIDATHVGYTIDPAEYYLDDPGLDADEVAALWLATGAIHLDGEAAEPIFRKLGGLPRDLDDSGHSVGKVAEVAAAPHLGAVFRAVIERREMTFEYRGIERRMEPHHLGFEKSRWYVVGRDLVRDARRVFRIDRFDNAPRLGEAAAFETPKDAITLRMEPWRFGDTDPVEAIVRVDAECADDLLKRIGDEGLIRRDDDGATVRIEVRDRAAFRHLILGFGESATVLEPPELVAEIVAWLEEALA